MIIKRVKRINLLRRMGRRRIEKKREGKERKKYENHSFSLFFFRKRERD